MTSDTDVAVIGVGCRFPEAWTPDEYWRNIDASRVSMRPLTDQQLRAVGVAEDELRAPDFVRVAATLPGAADFAADFFNIPPAEADLLDPQQRIFLEACWEALESAGHAPREDGPVIGVFAGNAPSPYATAMLVARATREGLPAAVDDLGLMLGGLGDLMASRVAYKLGLRGPAVGVQTACSSSLYAVHYATLSLLSGECDLALAGGSTVNEPVTGYRYRPGGLTSDDGYCRAFDARSSGTAASSGVGVVVLRRLADALADGDPVLAVVRGSAVGSEGADRPGFTAPTPSAVAGVVAAALRVAEVSADQLRYVEAHGSGTPLGDHIELLGLIEGTRASTARTGFCGLGSVKVNIGHAGAAAGIAGFIKAVHIARTGSLPPHPMFERARDPGLLADSPFTIAGTRGVCADPDRLVLVNSMGVGGTNVAAVLAPPPAPVRAPAPAGEVVRLMLSARTRTELDALCRAMADALECGDVTAADVAHTLRVGRYPFGERRVVTAPADQLAAALRLPRPPAARTVRATPCRAVLVGSTVDKHAAATATRLLAALPAGTETVPGPSAPAGRFAIHLDEVAAGDGVEEALVEAWLHGVDVRWEAMTRVTGRRLPLPTYPFQRRRFWALDRLPPFAAAPAAAPPPAAAAASSTLAAPAGGEGELEAELVDLWRRLFGTDTVGIDDEFGALGGTSLLYVRMALEIQQRHGVLINAHRAGGSRATVRRIAGLVRGETSDPDGELVEADLRLPLGTVSPVPAPGRDVLLTGATGFLGAFLLHELLTRTAGRVYCLVRADDEPAGRARLRAAAARFCLPEPDPDRVCVVPGDLRDISRACAAYRDGELAGRVGHVLYCAARVVFTEPYRVLREDNLLPLAGMLRWMRWHGIGDFSFVSSVAATGQAVGAGGRILETREQPLDPRQGGYGVSKWVAERLLERAERDGMRVRVFRPGVILAAGSTGACNDRDLVWHVLASGLAVGAHPEDERAWPVAPVDVVARAIVELAGSPGSAGRAYHLVDEKLVSPRRLFQLLADAGLPTDPLPLAEWQRRVATRALEAGGAVLPNIALYDVDGEELGEDGMEAAAWRTWLRGRGLTATPTGELLRAGLRYLTGRGTAVGELLAPVWNQVPATEPEAGR